MSIYICEKSAISSHSFQRIDKTCPLFIWHSASTPKKSFTPLKFFTKISHGLVESTKYSLGHKVPATYIFQILGYITSPRLLVWKFSATLNFRDFFTVKFSKHCYFLLLAIYCDNSIPYIRGPMALTGLGFTLQCADANFRILTENSNFEYFE